MNLEFHMQIFENFLQTLVSLGNSVAPHVGVVQLSCFRGRNVQFATFFNVSVAMRVTERDVHVTH